MQENKKKILIKVFGPDKPGITSTLTSILAEHELDIIDLGQSLTHGLLSLSILSETDQVNHIKDKLKQAEKDLDINLELEIFENTEKPHQKYKDKFIISSVHPKKLSSNFVHKLTELCATQGLNILDIENKSTSYSFNALDLRFGTFKKIDFPELKNSVMNLSHQSGVDIAIVKDDVFRFNKRLIVFDMDSTLIQCEVIEEIARLAGKFEKVKEITDRAMNGEIDFKQALDMRISSLKGVTKKELDQLKKEIPLTHGVFEFIKIVKSLGFKIAVLSGGFTYFANYFKQTLGLDYAFANELEFDENETLTGKLIGPIVDAEKKSTLLELLSQQEGISLSQVVAIGDGANDLLMLAKAGMGVAFHAKDIVKEQADHHMSFGPMTSILSFLGIPEDYLES